MILWRVESGKLQETIKAHKKEVTSLSFSADGDTLASASGDKTIKLWNPANGELLRSLSDHSAGVTAVTFSPRGHFASGSKDRTIKIWREKS